ncbi:hypothetical protein C0J52_01555 [Blattella germanica]|nr:hypothetical protein C0J52_01555 [Blattella germanica]
MIYEQENESQWKYELSFTMEEGALKFVIFITSSICSKTFIHFHQKICTVVGVYYVNVKFLCMCDVPVHRSLNVLLPLPSVQNGSEKEIVEGSTM